MPNPEHDQMTLRRFGEIVDAYGADPERWPPTERQAAERLLATSDEAGRFHVDAIALDTLLNLSSAPSPSPNLMARVLTDAGRPRRRGWLEEFWPFGPVWQPASAFAMVAMVGIVLGAAAPDAILFDVGSSDMVGNIESLALGFDLSPESGQ